MLRSLKVEMLVLCAIPNLVDTWTSAFGFEPVEETEKMQLSKLKLMSFPGTILLKKSLCESSLEGSGATFTALFSCTMDLDWFTCPFYLLWTLFSRTTPFTLKFR